MEIQRHLSVMAGGARAHGKIPVGNYASGSEISLPYIVVKGKEAGPCLWINGQVHGDELNGVIAAMDFINGLDPEAVKGSVIVTPTANPLAFDVRRKRTPQDDQDLDQTFPGNMNGFISERMSSALFREITAVADCVVSLHTMNPWYEAKPYAVYKVKEGSRVTEDYLLKCTSFFQPSVSCRMDVLSGQGELPGNVAGAIDYQCLLKDIPAFMVELGRGSYIEPQNVALAIDGLTRLSVFLGVLRGTAEPGGQVRRVTRRTWVTCATGGLFRSKFSAGDTAQARSVLGEVSRITDDNRETCSLDKDCVIIGVRRDPVVHTGERIAFVATEWDAYTLQS